MAKLIFDYSLFFFFATVGAFNLFYFFVILPKLTSRGIKVGGDAFFTFAQPRYVKQYFAVLTESESKHWHNALLRYSPFILVIWAIGFLALAFR